jgi:hypothetical protein
MHLGRRFLVAHNLFGFDPKYPPSIGKLGFVVDSPFTLVRILVVLWKGAQRLLGRGESGEPFGLWVHNCLQM